MTAPFDPLGRLTDHARKPYPEQSTGFSHLVRHWQQQYDAAKLSDEALEDEWLRCEVELATIDAEAIKQTTGGSELSAAQIQARQAKFTGCARAIEAEQAKRRANRMATG